MTERVGVVFEQGMKVEMRDGVHLVADVWRPATDRPVPVLVARSPYGRQMSALMSEPECLADAGYAVVIQDCRGRFDSDGEWSYVYCEVDDGYDTVEWAASQPWSNGRVGMFGASYLGYTQWLAAIARPPHLEAIAPEVCVADYWAASFDVGGAFRLSLRLGWTATVVAQMAETWGIDEPSLKTLREAMEETRAAMADPPRLAEAKRRAGDTMVAVLKRRPFRDDPLYHGRASWLADIFEHEARTDSAWLTRNPATHYADLDLPVLDVGGWYDIHLGGTIANYVEMRRQARTERARAAQRLVIGPWPHWNYQSTLVGEVDLGPEAVLDPTAMRIEWFDRWLRDLPARDNTPVRIFVMGENVWRDEQEWPLARTQYTPWFLHANGRLDTAAPRAAGEPDRYTYDPRDPAPSVGGRLLGIGEFAGAFDQRTVEARDDVLVYTSDELAAPVELTGPIVVELWASTSAPDTDFTAKLVDVYPDGRAINLCAGVVRARHSGAALPLAPGAVYRFTIDLVATSVVLPAGHRIRVDVSSSSFPEWEPNPNTGNPIGTDTDADLRPADQAIFHDPLHPSRVILPVIPR
jgi:putative CocE/NonD family hydrolase